MGGRSLIRDPPVSLGLEGSGCSVKPKDRIPAWPEQSAVMRVASCCLVLQAILPEALYMQVRKEIYEWDLRHDPNEGITGRTTEARRPVKWNDLA